MKKNEIKIIKALNKYFKDDNPILCPNQYHRFDAYNNNYIIEIKYRNKLYKDFLIEFDKYAYNRLYAEINNKKFLYVVGVPEAEHLGAYNIYVYNISQLDKSGYKYNWHMREMPKQTEFDKNWNIDKYVGYLELWAAKKIGEEIG